MTPDLIARVGAALYGPQWRRGLAGALGVSERTVGRWMAGDTEPTVTPAELAKLVHAHQRTLAALARALA